MGHDVTRGHSARSPPSVSEEEGLSEAQCEGTLRAGVLREVPMCVSPLVPRDTLPALSRDPAGIDHSIYCPASSGPFMGRDSAACL